MCISNLSKKKKPNDPLHLGELETRDVMGASTPPVDFEPFLEWVRGRSEAAWAACPQPSLAPFQAAGVGGYAWLPGTRWQGGLTDGEIAAAEARYGLRFPADYRTFLRILHAPNRHMFHAGFDGDVLVEDESPSFFDWLADDVHIREAIGWPLEGLVFDFTYNDLWREAWGPRPSDEAGARRRFADLIASAPPLVPVLGHRYLVEADAPRGHVVLSVYQADIIVYACDLRTLLLADMADLLGESSLHDDGEGSEADWKAVKSIPFWGELLE